MHLLAGSGRGPIWAVMTTLMDDIIADLPAIDLDVSGDPASTRIVVAMSGGVDSSVTAALVKAMGYDTVGITLQLYDHGAAVQKKGACCAGQDIHDARRVAEALDIPHYVLDYESLFRQSVIDDFVESYSRGETPIPCVRCNQSVKFRDLLGTAKDLGAAALATGHYIRRVKGPDGVQLHRGVDPVRDQSYFLFATTDEQLDFLRFPLGGLPKDETRRIAARMGLAVAGKPDSQDICFVPEGRYASVIEKLKPEAAKPGDIVHIDGEVLGQHQGIINYTIGQRRGLGVATGDPLFVVRLDPDQQQVIVGPQEAVMVRDVMVGEVNWLAPALRTGDSRRVMVKLRSTTPPREATVSADPARDGGLIITLDDAEAGVSPGQACVIYDIDDDGSRVLGGGWIKDTRSALEAA